MLQKAMAETCSDSLGKDLSINGMVREFAPDTSAADDNFEARRLAACSGVIAFDLPV